ncbi:MAG: ATP-dependent DNA helicase RecQ, partial [Chloroflexi bacterium]|nr:ATP-dependent DNA helicase RecQ [Chloroflexota bacterium]
EADAPVVSSRPARASAPRASAPRASPPPSATLPASLEPYRERLQRVFGYPDFRAGQAEVLAALAARDVLGVMPTGSGKSLCYVLPALEVGRTLVVSPLIALMQDQVEAQHAAGVAATFINSTLDRAEQNRRYADFVRGRVALLYVAPERFAVPGFSAGLRAAGVQLFAVDEAHCISEWGHDFRPDYLQLGAVRAQLGEPRTLALTATADPRVRGDILARLGIRGRATEVVTTFDRPNLRLAAVPVANDAERLDWVVRYVRARPLEAGIVYARTRRYVEEVAATLAAAGVRAAGYHAGMPAGERARVQRRFLAGELPVLVATNAFGMGIDKADVRYVVHTHLPGSMEAYYQEAGRAGRDGEPAECTLVHARRDAALQRRFIDQAHPDAEELRRIWRQLVDAQRFAGERPLLPREADEATQADGLATALTAFRASKLVQPGVLRLRSLDPDAPIDPVPVVERRRYAEARLAQLVEYAETPHCRRALILRYFGERSPERCGNCDNCQGTPAARAADYPLELFEQLLSVRAAIARGSDRAPYLVFEERTAREIATYRPRTPEALLAIWGMGDTRVRWFGGELVDAVLAWEEAHPDAPPPPRPSATRAGGTA